MAATADSRRVRARVEGTVQGVGFRPYVYRLAAELGISGLVLNDAHGVIVEAEADPATLERFLARLPAEVPPLALVERIRITDIDPCGAVGFVIAPSHSDGSAGAPVSVDTATCEACLAELHDPADRRYRYPFVNCTDCGPRFTIVRGVPYDRPLTTMAGFTMCPACQAEYEDPGDRRFHAEPNACPACGPQVRLVGADDGGDPVAATAALLSAGAIVAIKGIGGYHLACRGDAQDAVAALRARKHREDKPFALMAPDLAAARRLVVLTEADATLLGSRARPIVLAARRPGARVAAAVAPGLRELGVMLPYSPLHHLLLHDAGRPLVMTSANVSDEPIAYRDDDALDRLAAIADAFLLHDRPIETRTDDSVVRVVAGRAQVLRRSRGYVPASLPLPVPAPAPVLACGAEQKSTFCLATDDRAWIGHHIGDLERYETLRSFTEGIAHLERLFAVRPEIVAHDLHPQYLSTQYATELDGVRLVGVQHHHAHLAACLAEHGETGPALGAIYDGTGLGTDGTVWGGELLLGDLRDAVRIGHLTPVALPGGAAAVRQPWRMACAWLMAAYDEPPPLPPAMAGDVDVSAWRQVVGLVRSGVASPTTTSMGRLFDAVAALSGIRRWARYEGQAAIELEAACAPGEHAPYPFDGLDLRPTVRALWEELGSGAPVGGVAARFHATVAAATADALTVAAARHGVRTAVLSGGVFQNRRLLDDTVRPVEDAGLRVLVAERVPPNDGGISFGQAAVAAARS